MYHNLTAHYNGYYYAREKIEEIEAAMLKANDDDYDRIPPIYSTIDKEAAGKYEKEAKEAIKMASISIRHHPNSKWLYANYTMVGIARLYMNDLVNAIQTLKYVNTKSRNKGTRHLALIYFVRALTESEKYDQAKEVLQFLAKEKLSRKNQKRLYLNEAYYYQTLKDYEKMATSLTKADQSLTKKDRKGRIYLITGQVYQRIGLNAKAYTYYKKCIASNPPYKIDLYARLGLLQTTPLDDEKAIKKVNRTFAKNLKDAKNAEFQNKIYYERAEFEKKQAHLLQAIADYKSAVRAKGNKTIKGYAFLRLGQVHFDSLKQYTTAKKYYDSALSFLPQNIEHYDQIQKRQETLARLTKYMDIAQWQDSLLYMASIDSAALRQQLKSAIERQRKQEIKKKLETQKTETTNTQDGVAIEEQTNIAPGWYFENPSIIAFGRFEFQRIWENIQLKDNWRRSNRTIIVPQEENETASKQEEEAATKSADTPSTETNGINSEAQKIIMQLPIAEKQKKVALAKIEDAYFSIGEIFQFELDIKEEAIKSYQAIAEQPAKFIRIPEALYRLCLISTDSNTQKTNEYYQQLILQYPNSEFTKTLLDPNYQKKKQLMLAKQRELYQKAYDDFRQERIETAQEKVNAALQIGETEFTPTLELLSILIFGKTEDLDLYQRKLASFLKKYPDSPLQSYANNLLTASKKVQEKLKHFNAIRYIKSPNKPHYFALVYSQQSNIADSISAIINTLMQQDHTHIQSGILHKVLDDKHIITLVAAFPNAQSSLSFLKKFNIQRSKSDALSTHLLRTFVITKGNAKTLQRTKALSEYFAFFDRNYKDENSNLIK